MSKVLKLKCFLQIVTTTDKMLRSRFEISLSAEHALWCSGWVGDRNRTGEVSLPLRNTGLTHFLNILFYVNIFCVVTKLRSAKTSIFLKC